MPAGRETEVEQGDRMLDPRVIDPEQRLVQYSRLDEADIVQTVRVLSAIRRWRESEQRLSLRSRNHMKLNETDMKALRYLVVAKNENRIVTPGELSEYLNISSASTTKLLDRLGAAGHVQRAPHPTDRRALMVTITQTTHEQVHETVGRMHARRFEAAAALSGADRDVIIRFLDALSDADDRSSDE